jgi:glucuronate isomerase
MKDFLDKDFFLTTETSKLLYHDYASNMPVIDYHNHLSPKEIAEDINFNNLTQAWLYGDHYKWRAMRTNGVDEKFITGNANDWEKFEQWSATVPYTLRNPLYHWTHLELQRYFNINTILNQSTAKSVYDEANGLLASKPFSIRGLLKKMNVKVICTTDDPLDDLQYHQQISNDDFGIKVLPAFRPDKAMAVADPSSFNDYVNRLAAVANTEISGLQTFLDALKSDMIFLQQWVVQSAIMALKKLKQTILQWLRCKPSLMNCVPANRSICRRSGNFKVPCC